MTHAFRAQAPAKWALTGEHAVLRGAEAVVFPHPEYALELVFEPGERGAALRLNPVDQTARVRELLEQADVSPLPEGLLSLRSTIPLGAGFGSSAALCVVLARWILSARGLSADSASVRALATRLEHHFHGESSGMDVAVATEGRALRFRRGEEPRPLELKRMPRFTFHDTGHRASTQDCIRRVADLASTDPARARSLDAQMAEASQLAIRALAQGELGPLAQAMDLGQGCFQGWGLLPPGVETLEQTLRAQGALAVKLTGAGGGGFIVALWP
ncbi:MAG: hypothetical protein IT285_00285 [Bdellovibrionales bacterium]|nr:hypothetical protein [Bdellovibrionales bacterium]